jgi:hypothetical protein
VEFDHLFSFLGVALLNVGLLWLFYIALEPYVRRYWPGILVTWTRALSGQLVDANVGRDILVGTAVGVGVALIGVFFTFVPAMLGDPPPTPVSPNARFLLEARFAVAALLTFIPNAVQNATLLAVVFVLGRVLLRSIWGGFLAAAIVFSIFILGEESGDRLSLTILLAAAVIAPSLATLLYFGLLSSATMFFVNQVVNNAPMTLDLSQPHASGSLWAVAVVLALGLFGYYSSRTGQPLLGGLLQAD